MWDESSSGFGGESPILTNSRNPEHQKIDEDLNLVDLYKKLQLHTTGECQLNQHELDDYFKRIHKLPGGSYRQSGWLVPKIQKLFHCIMNTHGHYKFSPNDSTVDLFPPSIHAVDHDYWEPTALGLLTNTEFVTDPGQTEESINFMPKMTSTPSQEVEIISFMSEEQYTKDLFTEETTATDDAPSIKQDPGIENNLMECTEQPGFGRSAKVTKEECERILDDVEYNRAQLHQDAEQLCQQSEDLVEALANALRPFRIHSKSAHDENKAILKEACEQIEASFNNKRFQ